MDNKGTKNNDRYLEVGPQGHREVSDTRSGLFLNDRYKQ